MTIKIKFVSGKEIELTKEEYDELFNKAFFTPQFVPIPTVPYYPPQWPTYPYDNITITCKAT